MKKIITGIAAVAMAASLFAVDFSAKVKMRTNIIGGTIDLDGKDETNANSFYALEMENRVDDNNDFITTSVSGDKAGVSFNLALNDQQALVPVKLNSVNVWIQPIDMLTITFGNKAWELFSETTWSYGRKSAWGCDWYADGDNDAGFRFEVKPVDGLMFNAGFSPNFGNKWLEITQGKNSKNEWESKVAIKKWNVGGLVDLNSFAGIPVQIFANFKNAVQDKDNYASEISLGGAYGNAYAEGIYAHLVARLGFAGSAQNSKLLGDWTGNSDKTSMVIDNAVKYQTGAFNIWASVPVIIDLDPDNKIDNTGLGFVLKASYGLGSLTPYLKVSQLGMGDGADGRFADFKFKPTVELGADFNVGICSMNINVQAGIPGANENLNWKVPMTACISF